MRRRILYIGPGHSPLFRGRIAPFLEDHDACLVSTEPVPETFLARHPGLRYHLLPRPALRGLPRRLYLHTLDYVVEVWRLIRGFRPDLIHLHYVSQLDALTLSPVRRTPIVLTVMGADVLEDQIPRPWLLDQAVRGLFRRVAAVTAKSRFLAARCHELGAQLSRVHLLPWGVDSAHFSPGERGTARATLGLPAEATLLLSSRALQRLYNHEPLLDSVAALEREVRVVFTRNAEDADYARSVAVRAERLGVPAHFLPPVPYEQMPALYAAADACASLPASDGLPQTLLEALACHRPAVVLDLEAYQELPFPSDSVWRVAHSAGTPHPGALAEGLGQVLRLGPRAGLEEARGWIQANAELAQSVAAMRALYAALS